MENETDSWKGKEVLYFYWKEFYGFIPKEKYTVIEETENQILIERNLIFKKRIWCNKYKENIATSQICGYAIPLI